MLSGLDTTTSEVQNEGRRRQIREIHNMEAKQLRILFGVCLLFVVCHTCRIIRNLEDVYLRLIKGVDITTPSSWSGCAKGCASPMFIHMHVSQYLFIQLSKAFSTIYIYIYIYNPTLYFQS